MPRIAGIVRPGAAHLSLSLVDNDSEASPSALSSAQWTISAAPKSSASMYSQASYTVSPPVFSENKLDRRRFAIAMTPVLDGPWSRPVQLQSSIASAFVLNLEDVTLLSADPFRSGDDYGDEVDHTEQLVDEKIIEFDDKTIDIVPKVAENPKETSNMKIKKLHLSTKVLGKMLSRLSAHQPASRPVNKGEVPPLPVITPQILISLPSSGLKMPSTPKDALRTFVLEKSTDIPRTRSTWKPPRPPSPLPKSLHRHGKHKSDGSALAHVIVSSPPPPVPGLPNRSRVDSNIPLGSPKEPFLSFSTALGSGADTITSPRWAEIQMRLKARAMKSSTYAIHNGGIISPSS